jgi:phosphate transport system permease protein
MTSILAPSPNLAWRKRKAALFGWLCLASVLLAGALLVVLLVSLFKDGLGRIDLKFLTSFPSSMAEKAGIKAGLMGTLWVIGLTAIIAVPVGIAAAIFLEEFSRRKTRLTEFIQINIANLAGVPSIVYGLLGLAIFVRFFGMGRSVIAGALTMALLILPMIIIVSQEALRAVPSSYREGSVALGATTWQTIRRQVLPAAMPGILTGVILSISRAIGETAPLIMIGAVTYLNFTPSGLGDTFTVLPIQIFNWSSRPDKAFATNAAAAIVVLMAVLIVINSVAMVIRYRTQKQR